MYFLHSSFANRMFALRIFAINLAWPCNLNYPGDAVIGVLEEAERTLKDLDVASQEGSEDGEFNVQELLG